MHPTFRMAFRIRLATVIAPLLLSTAALAQYKAEATGAPPAEVPAAMSTLLQKQGTKISSTKAPIYEIWFVNKMPQAAKSAERDVTLPEVPHGSLLGVLKVNDRIMDRRGDQMKPGLYTLRYSYYPVNGAHQGIAPQRDFLVLSLVTLDADPATKPDFNTLMGLSEKSAGIPHPYVMSVWKQDSDFQAGLSKQGEKDWVLQTKIGDTPIALILVGVAES